MLFIAAIIAIVSTLNVMHALPLPAAPDNIICFPERDFCTIENFLDYKGQALTLKVNRDNHVVGGVVGVVSGMDVAFEVNHPGSLCWGTGLGPLFQVTPDLVPGDLLSLSVGNYYLADMTIQDGRITGFSRPNNVNVIRVVGNVAASVDRANLEVRVVNPDFVGTAIGRRDVRAIVGPLATNPGYTSEVVFTGNDYVATFTFDNNALAAICEVGAFSISMWQLTDAAGNAQGLTISEFGETGGPYAALTCPPAAALADPILPTDIVFSGNTVKWNPAISIPGTVPFTSYQVEIAKGGGANPQQVYSYRVNAPATQVVVPSTYTTISAGDVVGVRVFQGSKSSDYAYTEPYAAITNILPTTITPSPAGGSATTPTKTATVSFTSSISSYQIVYTMNVASGVEPFASGAPTASSIVYKAGSTIAISGTVYIKAVAFNTNGNMVGSTAFLRYTNPASVAPAAVTLPPVARSDIESIAVSWTIPNDNTITGYQIDAYEGTVLFSTVNSPTNSLRFIAGTTGNAYKFAVRTFNANYMMSVTSPISNEVIMPTKPDTITISSATYVAGQDFRVRGTGTIDGAVVTAYRATPQGTVGTSLNAFATVGGCIGGICTYDIRVRTNVPADVTSIYVLSDKGGRAGPTAVN